MSKAKTKPTPTIRFAALIRVSTEKQAEQGESLRTQESQINGAVKSLGGVITRRYAGQEHATAGWEREQLEKLLADAQKKSKPFDAVIVADQSRWSRENVASEIGLQVLCDNNIRFFVLTQEHDLNNDDARMFLRMSAVINQYSASVQVRKSFVNRVNRAKRNVPASGSLPFGRLWDDKNEKWSADPAAKTMMQDAAKRYLAGESIRHIAAEYGISESTLRDRFEKAGGKLPVEFHSDRLKIHETFTMDIPPLLDERTLRAIRKRADANTTYTHGHMKYKYLLNRMVFCVHCKSALSGQFAEGKRYYRHRWNKTIKCDHRGHANAEVLEDAVIRELFDCFGNPQAVQRAIEEATPDQTKVVERQKQFERLTTELDKVRNGRERVIGHIAKDSITEAQADKQLAELRQREEKLTETLERLQETLKNVPSPELIQAVSKQVAGQFKNGKARKPISSAVLTSKLQAANTALDKMTWDERRALVQMVFSGTTSDGSRMGVYIEKVPGKKRWKFAIHGHLIHAEGVTFQNGTSDDGRGFCAAVQQSDLLTKASSVTRPGRWVPTLRRKYFRRGHSRRRAGG